MDVTKDNEMEVVRQQFGIEDVGHLFNSSTLSNFSPYMLKKLNLPFKHNDRVIISKSANYTLRKSSFSKVSQGTFSRKTYVIDRPVLKANADHFFTVAWKIYGLEGLFYTSEIRKANWIEDDPDRNEDKEREKKRRDKLRRKRDQNDKYDYSTSSAGYIVCDLPHLSPSRPWLFSCQQKNQGNSERNHLDRKCA